MFKYYHPNVKAVFRLLKLLNVNVSKVTVNETLQNHPDWPALLCLSDGLTQWNVPNGAGKIDPNDIDQLPLPFLAYFGGEEPPLGIVTDVSTKEVTLYEKNYKSAKTIPRAHFLKRWSGIYLLAEPNVHSGERGYQWKQAKAVFSSVFLFGIPVILATLGIFLTNRLSEYETAALYSTPVILMQYYILLAGVFITSLLLWHEIDLRNPLLRKVCSSIKQGNCRAILSSRGAKVFSWLSWSDVGFFYFTGGMLSLLFVKNGMPFVFALNLLAFPYVIYSIYYQWRIVQQWCILCLLVQALLVAGAINVIGSDIYNGLGSISISVILSSIFWYLAPVYIWAVAKPLLLSTQNARQTRGGLMRIKFSLETFTALLRKEKEIKVSTDGMGIVLGDPSATNELIKVCNPYCGACMRTHPIVEQLLEKTPNLKVKIIFRTYSGADPGVDVVKHFLAIAAENNAEKLKRALDTWYLADLQDYDVFKKQFEVNGQLEKQTHHWEEMNKWCKATDITFTPTFFVNGRQLPDAYNVEDIQYFLVE